MNETHAINALGALAQTTRLAVFRALVKAGGSGVPAGELAQLVQTPRNTLSAHLKVLVVAKLITAERCGRSIIYRADFAQMANLLTYLLDDCCQAENEICRAVVCCAAANV